jgi:transposase
MVLALGSSLMKLSGVGPVVAGRILNRCRRRGPVRRLQPVRVLDRHRTSWVDPPVNRTGTVFHVPGNRRINRMSHIAAVTHLRLDTMAASTTAASEPRQEAPRSDALPREKDLRRCVSPAEPTPNTLVRAREGPGATQEPSAVDLPRHTSTLQISHLWDPQADAMTG